MTDDPSNVQSERCDLQLPADPDWARAHLRVLIEAAQAALTLLDLNDHDRDAWARQDWDALSPDAVAATEVLADPVATAYRDELDDVEAESQHLMEGAPPPREEVGGGTRQRHVLFSNEEDLEDLLADGAMPDSAAAGWTGVSDAELRAALQSGELSWVEYRDRGFIAKRSLRRYLAKHLEAGQSPQDGRG